MKFNHILFIIFFVMLSPAVSAMSVAETETDVETVSHTPLPCETEIETEVCSTSDRRLTYGHIRVSEDSQSTVCTPPFFALRNNLLLDAALMPNLSFEGGRGQWSAAATWAFAWWGGSAKTWRIYGGELEGRYWFGKAAMENTLTGHHAGVFVGLFTYDIKLGAIGRQCPDVAASWGLSYGYSFPIAAHFNLDFNLGIGFIHSHYERYRYSCGRYVCDGNRKQHYFGPVKAEISIVWLLNKRN